MTLMCIAHRGGPLIADQPLPENSLAAIARALDLGVEAIEIDVYQVGGELFVTHDRRLGRVVSGEGIINELPLDYLRKQTLANGEPLPLLRQVLELVADRALLNIEIKGADTVAALDKVLRDHLQAHQGTPEQYCISSFDHRQLYQALQLMPDIRRGILIEGIPLDYAACCAQLRGYSFNTHLSFLTAELLADARRRGLKNWVYTVNHQDDWQRLNAMGVDAVFTDRPDALMAYNKR